eukprot:2162133-Rhodomonas_salina.1
MPYNVQCCCDTSLAIGSKTTRVKPPLPHANGSRVPGTPGTGYPSTRVPGYLYMYNDWHLAMRLQDRPGYPNTCTRYPGTRVPGVSGLGPGPSSLPGLLVPGYPGYP